MSAQQKVEGLLMPKATAVWLIENTAISFEQIAAFTGLHSIEVQALADEEVGRGIVGRNPIDNNEVTQDEIESAEKDVTYQMKLTKNNLPPVKVRSKGPRYTPVSKRGDKPDAIAFILKNNTEITDAQIVKLIGTTKTTINNVRNRTHPNSPSIKPRHPVDLGLCTYKELEAASDKGFKAQGKDPAAEKAAKEAALQEAETVAEAEQTIQERADSQFAGFDFSNFLNTSGSSDDSPSSEEGEK